MDLLTKIRSALPWLPPDSLDDIVSEVAILVLEGRIEESNIRSGVDRFLPSLRKKYKGAQFDVSLDDPIGDEEGGVKLADVIHKAAPLRRLSCPNCRKKPSPGHTFCSRPCVGKYLQRMLRKIDPDELRELHKVRWLSREQIARILGVTRHGINNVIRRHKLGRFIPETCKVAGCGEPSFRYRLRRTGHLVGNLCIKHRRQKAAEYYRRWKEKHRPRLTPEERSESARKSCIARWAKPEWSDPRRRTEFAIECAKVRRARL